MSYWQTFTPTSGPLAEQQQHHQAEGTLAFVVDPSLFQSTVEFLQKWERTKSHTWEYWHKENVLSVILKKCKDLFHNNLIRHFNSENTDLPFIQPNYYSFLCYSPFSPSTRVISKLFLRGFSGLRTTVSPGWAARRADLTSPALRPYTRQLLL